jgi:hypothetical protein
MPEGRGRSLLLRSCRNSWVVGVCPARRQASPCPIQHHGLHAYIPSLFARGESAQPRLGGAKLEFAVVPGVKDLLQASLELRMSEWLTSMCCMPLKQRLGGALARHPQVCAWCGGSAGVPTQPLAVREAMHDSRCLLMAIIERFAASWVRVLPWESIVAQACRQHHATAPRPSAHAHIATQSRSRCHCHGPWTRQAGARGAE